MEGSPQYQRMLGSLRQNLGARIPGGLTEGAEGRLQRTLSHYVNEVMGKKGRLDEQDVLRETYNSMVNWLRKNQSQLAAVAPPTVANGPPAPPAPGLPPPDLPMDGEEDPLVLFERLKAARTAAPAPAAGPPSPSPLRQPELTPLPPQVTPTSRPVQQKDVVQRMEDVVKYREVEYNLLLNSKDRDWLHGTTENRYNFSVVLNGGTRPQGLGIQAMLENRFRNIVRIEFVKAMLPVEALSMVVPVDCSGNHLVEDAFSSVLALPYVTVTMDELQGNNYGTTDTIDKSLAVIQYDATWRSDALTLSRNTNRGYTLFFPKHMKAQRVYQPTPLANLQKMSFHLLNPENLPLSKTPDAVQVDRIIQGSDASGSCYSITDPSGLSEYLFIQTNAWFPIWSFSQMDRILLAGLTTDSATYSAATQTLNRWLQREEGHAVLGVAHTTDTGIVDGGNDCGYANYIILRSRFQDPRTGACDVQPFTGSVASENAFWTEVSAFPAEQQCGGVLNLSRQVQLVLRIVTRDMDTATNVRPDNI
jgi:hypothetical protein